jgi:hypothetical protein
MNENTKVRYLNKEETEQAIKDARKDGLVSSNCLADMSIDEQNRVKECFRMTFTDDRSAYHREYMANMKEKEKKQIITDEEEQKILDDYSKEKSNVEKSRKSKADWNNNLKKEVPIVIDFD